MAQPEPLTNEQRRLLKIAARMPLASVANVNGGDKVDRAGGRLLSIGD